MLEVTRAEGDPGALRRDSIHLDELIRQLVTDDSTIEAAARGCELRFTSTASVTVEGDSELTPRRAVENVIRNAIRYSPSGAAVEITLTAP